MRICPTSSFVALTYAVLNTRTLTVTLARAGSPYPLVRRNSGQLELLRPSGGVVGVTPDAHFAVRRIQLEPGDALLICSDGLDGVAIPHSAAHDVAGVFTRVAEEARAGCEESLQPAFAAAGFALADGGDDCGSVATQTAVLPARVAPGEALLTSPWWQDAATSRRGRGSRPARRTPRCPPPTGSPARRSDRPGHARAGIDALATRVP